MKYIVVHEYIHNLLECFSVVRGINLLSVSDPIPSNNINDSQPNNIHIKPK